MLEHNNESWTGDHILWYRDPVELVRNLFANPMFNNEIVYVPEKHFDQNGTRLYSEIHWSDWWWRTQVYIFDICDLSSQCIVANIYMYR